MTNPKHELCVPSGQAGHRLDRFLVDHLGGVSLRAARRLVERGLALVDERPSRPGTRLAAGQRVTVCLALPAYTGPAPRVLCESGEFAAFFKPAGLSTAALAGSDDPSLEALLPGLVQRPVQLVNRLDRATSGIVLGAFSAEAALGFRAQENSGRVDKRYLALAQGCLEQPMTITAALKTAGGAKVRVQDDDDPDPLRHTLVIPLAVVGQQSLVLARIAKGARHQIRAHLAHAGHPLAGDDLYGGPERAEGLALHHWRLTFEGFCAQSDPDWAEVQAKLEKIGEALCALSC